MTVLVRLLAALLLPAFLVACAGTPRSAAPTQPAQQLPVATPAGACAPTEPVWIKPPDDAAVQNSPEYGHYYVDKDQSLWASAWWAGQDGYRLQAGKEGVKVGWFRPAGATLKITGRRLDASAPALEASVPCCYPTRFQATGLYFPTEGCWEVSASAAESTLSFIVSVAPAAQPVTQPEQ
jgi:hypothetical protein